jgi:hypothetical protein
VPAAAAARQPSLFDTGADGIAGSIRQFVHPMTMVMSDFIATHLQLH